MESMSKRGKAGSGRSFYLVTLGCPKNEVDSEGIVEVLADSRLRPNDNPKTADVLIVNTCGFLEAARREAIETLTELSEKKRPGQILIATGCLAQRAGGALTSQVKGLDGIIGIRHWPAIGEFLSTLESRHESSAATYVPLPDEPAPELVPLRRTDLGFRSSAYLKIGDGCSAGCAFCTIPAIKGPMRSRPRDLILQEARNLVAGGCVELILVAQDTTSYGRDLGEKDGLHRLLEDLFSSVPDAPWLRLMYAYPTHLNDRLIETMAANRQLCHYLDMPLQHGHPDVLGRMGRPRNVEKIVRWIERLRQAVPDVAIRTTFIVGFPGETSAEYRALLDFVETVAFDRVGVFPFSREPGTPAYDMPDQIAEQDKQARWQELMQVQETISLAQNRKQIDRRLQVLVEGTDNGVSVGRSYRDAPEIDGYVLIDGTLPVGCLSQVRVTGAAVHDLTAKPLAKERG